MAGQRGSIRARGLALVYNRDLGPKVVDRPCGASAPQPRLRPKRDRPPPVSPVVARGRKTYLVAGVTYCRQASGLRLVEDGQSRWLMLCSTRLRRSCW
jgi:hypothetical protein